MLLLYSFINELIGETTTDWSVTGWLKARLSPSLNWRFVTGSNPPSPRRTPVTLESTVIEKVPSCAVVAVAAPVHVPAVTSIQTVALWIGPAPMYVPSYDADVALSDESSVTVTVKFFESDNVPSETIAVIS